MHYSISCTPELTIGNLGVDARTRIAIPVPDAAQGRTGLEDMIQEAKFAELV